MTLYDKIGPQLITQAIQLFYQRATQDIMIGYFFFNTDIDSLIDHQIKFTFALLDGPRSYKGKPLELAHRSLGIRRAHFGRRQTLMREVLNELNLDVQLAQEWLNREERLSHKIVLPHSCMS